MHAKKEITGIMLPIAALVCRMMISVWGAGKVVGLDSVFGGIPVAVEISEKGIYTGGKIDKESCWSMGKNAQEMID